MLIVQTLFFRLRLGISGSPDTEGIQGTGTIMLRNKDVIPRYVPWSSITQSRPQQSISPGATHFKSMQTQAMFINFTFMEVTCSQDKDLSRFQHHHQVQAFPAPSSSTVQPTNSSCQHPLSSSTQDNLWDQLHP